MTIIGWSYENLPFRFQFLFKGDTLLGTWGQGLRLLFGRFVHIHNTTRNKSNSWAGNKVYWFLLFCSGALTFYSITEVIA